MFKHLYSHQFPKIDGRILVENGCYLIDKKTSTIQLCLAERTLFNSEFIEEAPWTVCLGYCRLQLVGGKILYATKYKRNGSSNRKDSSFFCYGSNVNSFHLQDYKIGRARFFFAAEDKTYILMEKYQFSPTGTSKPHLDLSSGLVCIDLQLSGLQILPISEVYSTVTCLSSTSTPISIIFNSIEYQVATITRENHEPIQVNED